MGTVSLKDFCDEVMKAESWGHKTGRSTWEWSNPLGYSDWYTVFAKIPLEEIEQDPPDFFKLCFEDWYDNDPDLSIKDILDDIVDNHILGE